MGYNVKEYGAKGNGIILDTVSIQGAIDDCTLNGGGRVILPAGNYLVGKIILKDNVTLEICEGATLTASEKMEDYPPTEGFPESALNIMNDSRKERRAVIYACEAKNIAIVGRGTLDGRHEKFLIERAYFKNGKRFMNYMHDDDKRFYAADPDFVWRPVLIFIEACENVFIEEITLKNSPMYTLQLRSCQNINIQNIAIRNHIGADNADGIHFSSCKDVRISGCDLECGDDCIAIDSNDGRPSENYVIDNCLFISRNNCFRIFTCLGDHDEKRNFLKWGRVSDISISNCVVKDASSFVYVNVDQGIVERVTVTNAAGKINRLGTTFLITAHNAKADSITFSNWNFKSRGVGYIYSDKEESITNVKLENINVKVCPKTQLYGNGLPFMPTYENGLPIYWMSHYVPYFLQMICAEDISIRSLNVSWGESDIGDIKEIGELKIEDLSRPWPMPPSCDDHWPVLKAKNIKKLMLDGFEGEAFNLHLHKIELENVRKISIYRSDIKEEDIFTADCEKLLIHD